MVIVMKYIFRVSVGRKNQILTLKTAFKNSQGRGGSKFAISQRIKHSLELTFSVSAKEY